MAIASRRVLPLVVVIASFAGCGDDDPPQPVDLTVETFNVALAGSFVNFEAQRRPVMLSAIASDPSDVICIQEAFRKEDKDAIKAAVAATFPHVAAIETNLDTPIDPIDSDCEVAPAPTMPPCAPADTRAKLDAAIACLQANCNTVPGSADGFTTSTDCAQAACTGQAVALLFGTPQDLQCFGCLAPQLPVESFASMTSLCTTEVNAGLAFRGQASVMILSRHPLSDTKMTVMPGTWNRRIVLQSTATLPNGAAVDIYCNHTSAIFSGVTFPYTGRYGCGQTNENGWAHEQKLQTQKIIQIVEAAGARPAVVLGDFNTGREVMTGGVTLFAEAPENLDLLSAAFTPAVPASYTPACTYCPDNVVAGMRTMPVWIDHIFVKNIPAANVKSLERAYTQPMVTVPGETNQVHLSDHYGLRAVVTIAP
jgi:endonuclease/exonuclease/phosphatase family metal-dependent hydrolase